jgi:hypothetical protein
MPPTPTPLPLGEAYFSMSGYSLWNSTSTAIQYWNWLGDGRTVIQAIILIVLIAAALTMLYRFLRDFAEKGKDNDE